MRKEKTPFPPTLTTDLNLSRPHMGAREIFFEPPLSPYKPNVMNDKYLLVTFPTNKRQLRFMCVSY